MSASKEAEYACPECGADIASDAKSCPKCGVAFAWGEEKEGAVEAAPPAVEEAPVPADGTEKEGFDHGVPEETGAEPTAGAKGGRAPPPEAAPQPSGGRTFEVTLSKLGVVFLILTVVAVAGTFILMHWDVWVSGASKETIGPRQGLLIGLGYLGILVGLGVVVFDVLRHR